jgi:diadenosine tetraphosphatase ApaH/serine/threonine PP2A family protein phosphatase
VVNVGSVGQPRDEDPRLAVAIYDSDSDLLRIDRLDYDIDVESDRILTAGLPKILADRLWIGL